ncbi:thioesterase family protein, partial [Stenotrophomonas maltophilia]
MAFFERTGPTTFVPTPHTGGAWNTNEQHIAPAIGLLAHVLERDCACRDTGFVIGRLSYDILGPIPIEPVEADVQVVRPGRTIELVEGTLSHNQRPALRVRAWLMQPRDTRSIAGTPFARIAPPE